MVGRRTVTVVTVLLVAGVLAAVAVWSYAAHRRHQLDESSKAFVESSIAPIFSTWSKEELIKREVSALREAHTYEPGAQIIDGLFHTLSRLGPLRGVDEIVGSSTSRDAPSGEKTVEASYVVPATFQNGHARIDLDLRWVSGEWQICGFRVDSPLFKR
jgi:hypothetical protein